MNGPEHYREAERLIGVASETLSVAAASSGYDDIQSRAIATTSAMTQAAQVHATLALAAATALADVEFTTRHDRSDWMRVTKSEAPAPNGASS